MRSEAIAVDSIEADRAGQVTYCFRYSGPVIHGDADYAVHLGDYIYEYGNGGAGIGRVPSKGSEFATLDDYRQRYAQYRSDEDLASMHQNIPLIAIWDDHE